MGQCIFQLQEMMFHIIPKASLYVFYRPDGTEWVGNFQPGWTNLRQVIEFESTSNLLVIAGGRCYLINSNGAAPIAVFGVTNRCILKANNNRLVLPNDIGLTIVEADGTYWHSVRISWDGLEVLLVENSKVSGLAFNPTADTDDWVPFTYDIDTKILTGGSY